MPNFFARMLAAGIVISLLLWQARSILHQRRLLAGYRDIAGGIRRLRVLLRPCQWRREQQDVVLSGRFHQAPVEIRFSHLDHRPGLRISIFATCPFRFWLGPCERDTGEGKILRLGHAMLDAAFVVRTDRPIEAKLFFSMPSTLSCLSRLCYSRSTTLSFQADRIAFTEDLLPAEPAPHVATCLEHLTELSRRLEQMPARRFAAQPSARRSGNHTLPFRVAACLALAVMALLLFPKSTAQPPQPVQAAAIPAGIAPEDAVRIPNLQGWRLATAEEISPADREWLHSYGFSSTSSVHLDPHGRGREASTAYLLVSTMGAGTKRVVWIVGQRVLSDVQGDAAAIARVPKSSFSGLSWKDNAPAGNSDGDGLLVLRGGAGPGSVTLFYLSNGAIQTASPDLQR